MLCFIKKINGWLWSLKPAHSKSLQCDIIHSCKMWSFYIYRWICYKTIKPEDFPFAKQHYMRLKANYFCFPSVLIFCSWQTKSGSTKLFIVLLASVPCPLFSPRGHMAPKYISHWQTVLKWWPATRVICSIKTQIPQNSKSQVTTLINHGLSENKHNFHPCSTWLHR